MMSNSFQGSQPIWNFSTVESMDNEKSADRHVDGNLLEGEGLDSADANGADNGTEVLDPAASERRIYSDQITAMQREIWRPGDGDGDQSTDYYDRVGLPLPLEQRWRFFQTDIGPIDSRNHPPRFVILDDYAASAVLRSDIQKAKMVRNWPHDFGGGGKIRVRRPHRGRPAIRDPKAKGNAKYYGTSAGGKKENYLFTGEKNYKPAIYRYEPPKPTVEGTLKRKAQHPDDYNPRAHGHNQFTPKDLLVKHGAPSFSRKEKQIRAPRINTFLPRDPPPPSARDRSLYGGIAESAQISVQREAKKREKDAAMAREDQARCERTRLHEEEERDVHRAAHGPQPVFGINGIFGPGRKYTDGFPIERLNGLASIPAHSRPLHLPPNMSFAAKSAFEQNVAAQLLANIETEDDVIRLALELSRAKIQVSEQVQEIERLEDALSGM